MKNHAGFELWKTCQDTLVDADIAINSMMWQNAGRSGIDQWILVFFPDIVWTLGHFNPHKKRQRWFHHQALT